MQQLIAGRQHEAAGATCTTIKGWCTCKKRFLGRCCPVTIKHTYTTSQQPTWRLQAAHTHNTPHCITHMLMCDCTPPHLLNLQHSLTNCYANLNAPAGSASQLPAFTVSAVATAAPANLELCVATRPGQHVPTAPRVCVSPPSTGSVLLMLRLPTTRTASRCSPSTQLMQRSLRDRERLQIQTRSPSQQLTARLTPHPPR
jgi:hypothetical protein